MLASRPARLLAGWLQVLQVLAQLQTLADDGLLQLHADGFALTPTGWLMVRAVAMVFDKHLQADLQRSRYSQII